MTVKEKIDKIEKILDDEYETKIERIREVVDDIEDESISPDKIKKAREEMMDYCDGFVMFGRRDIAYAVDNCIKMLDKALEE